MNTKVWMIRIGNQTWLGVDSKDKFEPTCRQREALMFARREDAQAIKYMAKIIPSSVEECEVII